MELRQYLTLLLKWAWLIILIMGIAIGSTYFFSRTIPPTYQATTTLLVGRVLENPNPSTAEVQTSGNLAQAYALLATQPPILQSTADAINWPEPWQSLYFKVSANTVGNQLLRINVMDGDAQRAKLIADTLANQLISQGPISSQQKQAEEQRAFLTSQLTQLRQQIERDQKTLTALTAQATVESDRLSAGLETNPGKLNDLNARIATLQTRVDNAQQNYTNMSALLNNVSNLFLTVLAPAQLPTAPSSPNIPQNILLAAFASLILSGGSIFLLEYLDDTVKDADGTRQVLNQPTLGTVWRIPGIQQPLDHLIVLKHPRSPLAESFRVLRTNLRFAGIENPSGVVLVTSANPSEGKTLIAANLAITSAQAGKRVMLLDADLRRATMHHLFGLSNKVGLSNLFLDHPPALQDVVQSTSVEGLRIVTSGPQPPNPAEILDSDYMDEILTNLRSQVDLLILDSPPVLAVADSGILGSRCSGAILIIKAGKTRSDACRHALARLAQANVKVLGVVLNGLSRGRAPGYTSYYYSS